MNYHPALVEVNELLPKEFYSKAPSNIVYRNNIKGYCEGKYRSPYSLKYVVDGEVNYFCNNHHYRLHKNDLLVVNEGTDFEFQAGGMSNIAYSVCLESDVMNEVFRNLTYKNGALDHDYESTAPVFFEDISPKDISKETSDRLKSMMLNLNKDEEAINEQFFYLLCELILNSHLAVVSSMDKIDQVKEITRKEIYKRVYKAVDYIKANFKSKFDLASVAEASCMSKFYIIKHFHNVVGLTPNEFHIHERVSHAKELLVSGNHSISETGAICGYADLQTFSKQFKRVTGQSPSIFLMASSN